MRWLSNTIPGAPAEAVGDQTQAEADEEKRRWLADKVIGEPKATAIYTREQLKAMGVVGVYAPECPAGMGWG